MTEPLKPAGETTPEEQQPAAAEVTDEPQHAENQESPPDAAVEKPAEEPQKKVPDAILQERLERMRRKQRSEPVPQLERDPTFMPNMNLKEIDAALEQELEEAMGGLSEEQMFGEMMSPKQAQEQGEGKHKKGTVISVHGADVFVEIPGSRSQGYLPMTQFPEGRPDIGTEVEIEIEGYDNQNGLLILTRRGAAVHADWSTVAEGMVVEARVLETNKGGLSVDVNGIRGFMPISQIDLFRVENAEEYVNQKLLCEVTEVKPEERNLVVSRRNLLERDREEQREKMWDELVEGQVRDGVVRKVQDFGAFVDIGGVDGLLHVSEMSWMRVNHPKDVVEPGQAIKVAVLKVDRERQRISLGLKQLEASPWDDVKEKYPPGSTVKGKITRLAEFGAFVELEPSVEGLVHISELAHHRVKRVAEVVAVADEVDVQVLEIDMDRKRIALSLKAANVIDDLDEAEEDDLDEAPAPPRPKSNVPLRGGIGSSKFLIEEPQEEEA